MFFRLRLAAIVAPLVLLLPSIALAAEFEVTSKTGPGGEMFFEPDLLRIAPGDTVHFTVTSTGVGHDVSSIRGMIPEGAEAFRSEPEEAVTVTFTVPGVYGFKCGPHNSAYGMVGLLVVGDPVNLEAAKAVKQLGKAKAKFEELFAELESPM